MKLYFDTETTGIPNRALPWNHERQPRIVSIAWQLVHEDWTTLLSHHALIKPDGWTIDPEGKAFAAHRISQERCEAEGISIANAIEEFRGFLDKVDEIVAYNIEFDIDMTRIETEHGAGEWLAFPRRLDILPLAQIACQMPPTEKMIAAKRNGFKPPKLSEALKILCKEDFPDAHDALADVRATIKIHKAIEELRNADS